MWDEKEIIYFTLKMRTKPTLHIRALYILLYQEVNERTFLGLKLYMVYNVCQKL